MIEVQHLTKQYGRFTAVDDVTFRVDKGEILGFLGPNGAGKTTTMRILTGYMPATAGKAVIAGFDIFDQPIEAKRRIGYLPETPPLYPDMTVRDYLMFVGADPRRHGQGAAGPGRHRHGEGARRRRRRPAVRPAVEGLQAARRAGPGHPAQPRSPDPRRADRRPRPEADHGDPRPHQGARRLAHDRAEHAHPARGLADLRAGRHHQQGQGGGDRHAGRADRSHPGQPDDLRAGRRAGGHRHRRGARRRARRLAGDAGRTARHAGQLRDRLPQGRGPPARSGAADRDAATGAWSSSGRRGSASKKSSSSSRPAKRRAPRPTPPPEAHRVEHPRHRQQGAALLLQLADRLRRDRAVRRSPSATCSGSSCAASSSRA